VRFKSVPEGDDSKKSFKRLHRWRYSPTAAYGNNEVHLHPYKARRLTVAEALAIQSLPKNFVLPPDMTLSDKFKAVGNGVPFLAAKSVAATINNFIKSIL
jgi:DNA (cytosine-5)-methyltransferase 1